MRVRKVEIHLPRLHKAQEQIKNEAARFNVLNCGRRFGKDVLGQDLVIRQTLDALPCAWFAPTYRMMFDNFRDVSEMLRPVATKVNASEHRIELVTRGVVDFWSLDVPDVARGRKYKRVIVNEAAMVSELRRNFENVVRPTLADYAGDAWFLSTPRGHNDFKELYDYALTREDWRAWTFTTYDNPHIARAEVDAMRASMAESAFRQEILAEFVSVEGALFRREQFRIVESAPSGLKWIRTYDLALTKNEWSDRTASLCGAQDELGNIYIRDGFAMRAEYPEVKARMVQQGLIDGRGVNIVIESVAFQLAAVQELHRESQLLGYTIVAEKPVGDKIARLRPAQARAEQGQICLVRGNWVNDFLDEVTTINAEMTHDHDDYGDALSSLIKHLPEPSRVQTLRRPQTRPAMEEVLARVYG